MDLLPEHHNQFSSVDYWEGFFRQRGEAFEWYGSFHELRDPLLRALLFSQDVREKVGKEVQDEHSQVESMKKEERKTSMKEKEVLVVGCGNSSFSADLYDCGFSNIVNIDFSPEVIAQMKKKNEDRPKMRWEVMDMTNMAFSDESFEVIFDKGALDALMSVEEEETRDRATQMFQEIHRVLRPNGKYVCISLCEEYIATHLFRMFLETGLGKNDVRFSLQAEIVQSTTPSPLKPFILTFTKPPVSGLKHRSSSGIRTLFDSFGSEMKDPIFMGVKEFLRTTAQIQSFNQKRYKLSQIEVGRSEIFDVHAKNNDIPRFSIIVYDHTLRASRSCAVFFVPPGRETEYQFTSAAGLASLASQAQCRRLLAVRCNRPHVFPAMPELQKELSPIALHLAPADMGPIDKDPIPFMAVSEESEWEIIDEGTLPIVGDYVIEETVADKEEDIDKYVWRRLLFLQNQHFIQTEAKLLFPKKCAVAASNKKKKGGKAKGKGKAKKPAASNAKSDASETSADVLQFDSSYLDGHHKAMLLSLLCDNTDLLASGSLPRSSSAGEISESPKALVVGLGGGALVMALQRLLPSLQLEVAELVPGLDALAARFFGFCPSPRCCVTLQDGVARLLALGGEGGRLHAVLLDVDSKDNSAGLSAPPPSFLRTEVLRHVHDEVLLPGGSLCLNVVARDQEKLADLLRQLKSIFCGAEAGELGGRVYSLRPSADTVNLVVHAVKSCSEQELSGLAKEMRCVAIAAQSSSSKKKKALANKEINCAAKARSRCLDSWLTACHLDSDPLELRDMVDLVTEE